MIKKIDPKQEDPMILFMKNRVSKNKINNNSLKNYNNSSKNAVKNDENSSQEDDLSEQEKLEQAKKESNAKASKINQFHLISKMIFQETAKYVLLIAIFCGLALLLIKATPLIFKFFHGLFKKILLNAI